MKIVILGSGAMGSLFGGYLSARNEVYLVDIDEEKVDKINRNGVKIRETDGDKIFRPKAVTKTSELGTAELIIVFVKAMFSKEALTQNKNLIGKDTFLMTMQNGFSHEQTLLEFADKEHVIIGTTQHNSSIIETGYINHGGGGTTSIGTVDGKTSHLQLIRDAFTESGFDTDISENVQKIIWKKAFLNTSASVLTGILQVRLGYLTENESGWKLVKQLVLEAVDVANADGMGFDSEEVLTDVRASLERAQNGYTSIYADIRDGRRTEVDTINGSVVQAAKRNGTPARTHEFIVELVHAIEGKREVK